MWNTLKYKDTSSMREKVSFFPILTTRETWRKVTSNGSAVTPLSFSTAPKLSFSPMVYLTSVSNMWITNFTNNNDNHGANPVINQTGRRASVNCVIRNQATVWPKLIVRNLSPLFGLPARCPVNAVRYMFVLHRCVIAIIPAG